MSAGVPVRKGGRILSRQVLGCHHTCWKFAFVSSLCCDLKYEAHWPRRQTEQIRQTAYSQILALRNTPYGLSNLGWSLPLPRNSGGSISRGSHLALPVNSSPIPLWLWPLHSLSARPGHLPTLTQALVPSCPRIGCTDRGFVIPQM